ncbi:MAG: A/G-specific adenine glycosylase [Planctomycetota bacterium]
MPLPGELSSTTFTAVRRKLLSWYDRRRRDLPWRRRAHDAYAQWVAEIMLQQTRVETVMHYYEPFLQRFPDVAALALADRSQVMKAWEGLGYYRRALHLHEAARVVHRRGGELPRRLDEWRELPGVGDYTAAAIASIAQGEAVAAVDGNVARVVARVAGVTEDVRSRDGLRTIRALGERFLSRRRPGDFNQAWMDLGSIVCTPRFPHCPQCPLRANCSAARLGRQDEIPVRAWRTKPRTLHLVVAAFPNADRLLMRRRPEGGLWSGLWELPSVEVVAPPGVGASGDGVVVDPITARVIVGLARAHGLATPGSPTRLGSITHVLTHRRLQFEVFLCRCEPRKVRPALRPGGADPLAHAEAPRRASRRPMNAICGSECVDPNRGKPPSGSSRLLLLPGTVRWVSARERNELPVSRAYRRILEMIDAASPPDPRRNAGAESVAPRPELRAVVTDRSRGRGRRHL